MKRFASTAACLFIFSIALISAPAKGELYTATVVGGFGSGNYAPGTEVFIEAYPYEDGDPQRSTQEPSDANAPLTIFDRWEGDTDSLSDTFALRASFIMPPSDISLTAVYKASPRWAVPSVIAEIPADPSGVIFIFHGLGGSAQTILAHTDTVAFIQEARSRGIGVVAVDCYNRSERTWDLTLDPAQNIDLQRTAAVRRHLVETGQLAPDVPVYVLGISYGGLFASLFDQAVQTALDFPVAAAALYVSPGDLRVMSSTSVPTIFALAENDDLTAPAIDAFNSLVSAGTPAQLLIMAPRPLHPGSFWRISGFTLSDSETVYDALQEFGFIDGDGYLTVNPDDESWRAAIPITYFPYLDWIEDQLRIGYASHTFMSEFNSDVIQFLQFPTAKLTLVPEVESFEPPSGGPGTSVNVYGEGFVGISSVTLGDVPATFAAISATQLRVIVPAGAVTGPITVTNSAGSSTSLDSFVVAMPQISDLDPDSGYPGDRVNINGSSFVDVSQVTFSGIPAEILSATASTLAVRVPTGVRTGPVTVKNYLGTATSPVNFEVLPPSIRSFSPTTGSVGTRVTISGVGFAGLGSVKFNGVPAQVVYAGASWILVRVPEGATSGPISVTAATGAGTSTSSFTVN